MKKSIVSIVAGLVFYAAVPNAQPLPSGLRLKEIPSNTLVGAFMQYCDVNNYVGNVGSREFNIGQSGGVNWGTGMGQWNYTITNNWRGPPIILTRLSP